MMQLPIENVRGTSFLFENGEKAAFIMKQFRNSAIYHSMIEVFPPLISDALLFERDYLAPSEMFSFQDKSKRNLCLVPEHTLMIANNYVMHEIKAEGLFYLLPTFRYERPQKNRYRQFWQLGLETFKKENELLILCCILSFLKSLPISVNVETNFVGNKGDRGKFIEYLEKNPLNSSQIETLCSKCCSRYNNKKFFRMMECYECDAANITDIFAKFVGKEEKTFDAIFQEFDFDVKVNQKLIRGIDYYDNLVFEFKSNDVVIGGGGRYQLEKRNGYIGGFGFAFGCERILNCLGDINHMDSISVMNCDDTLLFARFSKWLSNAKLFGNSISFSSLSNKSISFKDQNIIMQKEKDILSVTLEKFFSQRELPEFLR